ncbi:MAG TPA: NrtA/SsuA/CpmA family ABC transporter substrate-binding protein, partial [Puia sp.]|nr:NrtA/SsuA/CpmA family ABC transporter substrate-binding protein [Puia sp.]
HGLEVTLNYVKTGKIAMDDLVGGKAQFANIVETNIAFAGYQQPPIQVIANIEKVYDAAIIGRKDKGINRPEDLKGKKIGIMLATTSQIYADRLLAAYHIPKDQVTMVGLLPPAMQSALLEGSSVDAISLWQPYIYNVQNQLKDNASLFVDRSVYTGYMALAGNKGFITANPQTTRNLLAAYIDAEQFLRANPQESKQIVARVLSLGRPVVDAIWDQYAFDIRLQKELYNATVDEGKWVQDTQKDFAGKPLPDYSLFFNAEPLRQIDSMRVKW